MRVSHGAAVWMLERLGLDSALTGDLLEEYARDRSTFWYWKQVLIAMWTGAWSAILSHKLLAVRAVATGYAVDALWSFLLARLPSIVLPLPPRISLGLISMLLIILLTQMVTGWIVARTHRAHAVPMVFLYAIWLVVVYNIFDAEARRLLVDSIDQPRFRAYLVWHLMPIPAHIVGLFLGGVVGAKPLVRSIKKQSASLRHE